jgi:hypothetical protein
MENLLIEGAEKVKANNKYSAKLSYKRMKDLELSTQANDFLKEKNIFIPYSQREFRGKEDNCLVDIETGEVLVNEYLNLAKMIYDFRGHNRACYDLFPNPKDPKKMRSQILTAWYSKHRCSNVWSWKKSKLIRSMWGNYLKETLIHEKYQPMHLVLTVPHANGEFNNKKFYATEILKAFNLMRKSESWKDCIFGGEYGLEVKKSKEGNGLHIHLHCLVFQYKHKKINEVREFIKNEWNEYTGAQFIHYETLYVYKKSESGGFDMVQIPTLESWHEDPNAPLLAKHYTDTQVLERKVGRFQKKKYYLDESQDWYAKLSHEEKLKEFTNGVLECIKYHFKADWCEMPNGKYDIELINEVLNHSKGMRFYSKFGGFYGEKRLNYDYLQTANHEELEQIENEGVEFASSDKIETNIINPYTYLPAKKGEFKRFIAVPEKKIHKANKDIDNPNMPLVINPKLYYQVKEECTIKDIIKALAKNNYQAILTNSEYERFALDHMSYSQNITREFLNKMYYQDAKRYFDKSILKDLCNN